MKFNQIILILFVSKCKITLEIPTTCVRILINDVFIKPGIINNLRTSVKFKTPSSIALPSKQYTVNGRKRIIS